MLIRLMGHFLNNPAHIDKLICINGLPEAWLFRNSKYGGKELMPPWEADIEENIPQQIRHLCDPMEVTFVFPPLERGGSYTIDKKIILGLRFNFLSQPGMELWEKIDRYLERMTPRDEKVPAPVIVAIDHKSGFNPHVARRTVRGSLEFMPCQIPIVNLKVEEKKAEIILVKPAEKEIIPLAKENEFACQQCSKVFEKERALKMHVMRGHRIKEAIGV